VTAFEEKMGEVAAANPEDMEAAILHALVTSANFDPTDRTYANQLRRRRSWSRCSISTPTIPAWHTT
jgi:hypothetical protein